MINQLEYIKLGDRTFKFYLRNNPHLALFLKTLRLLTLIQLSWTIMHLTKPEFLNRSINRWLLTLNKTQLCYTSERHTKIQPCSISALLYGNVSKYPEKGGGGCHTANPSGFYPVPPMKPLPGRKCASNKESHHLNVEGDDTESLLTNQKCLTFWSYYHRMQKSGVHSWSHSKDEFPTLPKMKLC